jgi:hypothetical protein
MISILILLICISAIISKDIVAILFAMLIISHDIMAINFSGWMYYLSGATLDFAFILAVSMSAKPNKMVTALISLSFCSILVNFYGWVIWYNYMLPYSYNNAFVLLYSISIYVILRRHCARGGNNNIFSFSRLKSSLLHRRLQKETTS